MSKPYYASAEHIKIVAVVMGTSSYESFDDAKNRIEDIKKHFITSNKIKPKNPHGLVLWIKGFKIEDNEKKAGFLGNFGEIILIKKEDGLYSISCRKISAPLKVHPQKIRPKRAHPNYGHPVIRNALKGVTFEKKEQAQEVLQGLHLEFPKSSIKATEDKIYIQIYSRKKDLKIPIVKCFLYIYPIRNKYAIALKESDHEGLIERPKVLDALDTIGSYTLFYGESFKSQNSIQD